MEEHRAGGKASKMGWKGLATMAALSFLVMYVLMYMMVDRSANVYANINQFTME